MNETTGVLTPQVRRQYQQALADCTACKTKLDYLRALGLPNEELEARADHTRNVVQTALEIDEQSRLSK